MAEPKLRFKREDGTELPQLNKCCFMDLVDGKISNGLFTETSRIGSGVKLINVSNLYDEPYINYDKLDLLNVDVEILESNRVKPFDLLFTRSSVKAAGVAHCNIYTGNDYDVVFDGHIMKASIKTNSAIPMYVKYLMDSPHIRNRTLQKAKTGAFTTIGQEDLGSVILTITPSIEEQQKIADFLSTVDEVIAQSEAEVKNLEQQKKAAVQKIFSQEVRFSRENRTEFSEWEKIKLENAVDFLDEKRKPITSQYRNKGQYPYYGASGIIDYVDDYIFDEELVLLSEDGANIVDRNYRVSFIATGKYWVNNHAHCLRTKKGFSSYFISEALENIDYTIYNTGSAQPKLNQEVCRNLPLFCPCFEEQQKIADFLSTYDEAIIYAKQELDKWKELKKGLLQQMFA